MHWIISLTHWKFSWKTIKINKIKWTTTLPQNNIHALPAGNSSSLVRTRALNHHQPHCSMQISSRQLFHARLRSLAQNSSSQPKDDKKSKIKEWKNKHPKNSPRRTRGIISDISNNLPLPRGPPDCCCCCQVLSGSVVDVDDDDRLDGRTGSCSWCDADMMPARERTMIFGFFSA